MASRPRGIGLRFENIKICLLFSVYYHNSCERILLKCDNFLEGISIIGQDFLKVP